MYIVGGCMCPFLVVDTCCRGGRKLGGPDGVFIRLHVY